MSAQNITGIELRDAGALLNVDDAYLFTVVDQGNGFSFQSVSTGTYLANRNGSLCVRETYDSSLCDWILTPYNRGMTMMVPDALFQVSSRYPS